MVSQILRDHPDLQCKIGILRKNHFSVCAKFIVATRYQSVGLIIGNILAPCLKKTVVSDIVVIAVKLIQAFVIDTDAVLIEGEVTLVKAIRNRTVEESKFTVCAEGVFTGGEEVVHLFGGQILAPGQE